MKKMIILLGIALLLLAGCAQQEQPLQEEEQEGMFLQFKYTLNEAVNSRVTIHQLSNEGEADTRIQETIMVPVAHNEDGSYKLEAYLSRASKIIDGNSYNVCENISVLDKKNMYTIYPDGLTFKGESDITNFFIPNNTLSEDASWKYDGLTYALGDKTTTESMAGSFGTIEIIYSGTRNENRVEGKILFDYENGRIVKKEESHFFEQGDLTLLYELIGIIPNFNREQHNLDCANSGYEGPFVIPPKPVPEPESDMNTGLDLNQ